MCCFWSYGHMFKSTVGVEWQNKITKEACVDNHSLIVTYRPVSVFKIFSYIIYKGYEPVPR